MGRATSYAFDIMEECTSKTAMKAGISIKDRENNQFYNYYAYYGMDNTTEHVELILFKEVYKHFKNNFKNIPDRTNIVVACRFSPCRNCTKSTIPDFCRNLDLAKRRIRLRFRYVQPYTKAEWESAVGPAKDNGIFWNNEREATDTYNALGDQYGSFFEDSDIITDDEQNPMTLVKKEKRRLDFARGDKPIGSNRIFEDLKRD